MQLTISSSQPRVSVICATYNGSRYLEESVRALRTQTEASFETVFVDDCSQDGTFEILSASVAPGIVVSRNSVNLGVVTTRNRAIELSSGRYLAINDQDDISLPTRLSEQARLLDRHPQVSCIFTRYQSIDETGIPFLNDPNTALGYSGEHARAGLLFKNFITHSTVMFRRESINGLAYTPEYPLCEDYSLLMRLSNWKHGLLYLPKKLIKYRNHSSNQSKSNNLLINQLAIRLKHETLTELGVFPSENETRIHEYFNSEPFTADHSILPVCREWLSFLAAKNRERRHFDPIAFEAVIANEWLELCHRFSDGRGSTWREYRLGGWTLPVGSLNSAVSLWLKTRTRYQK